MRERLLAIAEPLMRLPTAPFREEAVRTHIRDFCRARGMAVRQDAMGNLMADWGLRAAAPTLVLEAHMDHPGFIIETSREWPHARRGDGVVVRVGDVGAVFDPRVTRFMMHAAETVARHDRAFKVQRKLMDGGTCESSVYQAFGHATGAVCIPLGNYHNRNFARGRIAAERISIPDLVSMTQLFVGMAERMTDLGRFLYPPRPVYREIRGPLGERFMAKRPAVQRT